MLTRAPRPHCQPWHHPPRWSSWPPPGSAPLHWADRARPALEHARLPHHTSLGVGLSFFAIAAGQAVGAPIVGRLTGSIAVTSVFYAWALLAILGATL